MASLQEEIAKQEERVICRALRDSNNPKIVKEDEAIFNGLIDDLFPGVKVDRLVDAAFEKLVAQSCKDRGLEPESSFIIKVVEFEELLQIRHSIFILGKAATGKSSVWEVLGDTYKKQGKKFVHHILNPKAVTTKELFGFINPATREWKDGIFSTIMRNLAEMPDTPEMPKFIVADGDIDALWIESMNTIMDDNKVLTLASNERIPLRPSMRLIFEIGSLTYASPATVSRAGIIYVNVSDVGWPFYFESWTEKLENSLEMSTLTVFEQKYIEPCLDELERNYKTIVPILDMAVVESITRLMSSLLNDYNKSAAAKVNAAAQQANQQAQLAGQSNQAPDYSKDVIEYLFVFAIIWSVGGSLFKDELNNDFKKNFSKFWRPAFPKGAAFPTQGDIFDYFVDINQETGQPSWKLWADMVEPYEHSPEVPVNSIHVETVNSYRLHYIMDHLIKNGYPVLLAGAAGLGKSVLLKSKLRSLNDQLYQNATISMNYYTTSAQLQMILETYIEKKVGNKFAPIGNRKLIYMIDDLNMSKVDEYGTQQPIALLREHMDWGFWFDRDKLVSKEVSNVEYVATMNPYAGSFEIDPEYQWHYTTFAIDMPSETDLTQIYGSILNAHMTREGTSFKKDIEMVVPAVVKTLLKIHNKIAMEFLPTSIKFHYQFNLRDLTNIVAGIMKVKPDHYKEGTATLVQLLMHECERVYCDRMCEQADKDKYTKITTDIIKQELATIQVNDPSRPKSASNAIQIDMDQVFAEDANYFTNFSLGIGEGSYASVETYQRMNQLLNEALVSHNENNAEMNLVLFRDAMQHVCRISRIIKNSDALLVGVGGSGKESLAKLAAFINEYEVFSIVISSTYSVADFKADLRKLYRKAGEKEIPTMFLFTDQQIVNEEFLVYINDLLSSGFIAGLWPADEEEEVINNMRGRVKDAGLPETKESIMNFFIEKVKENLHVVLGFSPNGDAFRIRCRKFPSLVNCTTIDWFMPWPYEALESVAFNFISNREKSKEKEYDDVVIDFPDDLCKNIAKFMAHANELVTNISEKYEKMEKRYAYTTPKSFLELISLYLRQLYARTKEIEQQITRLENGSATLIKTEQDVNELKNRLEQQRVEVRKEEEAVASMIGGITEERNKVSAKAADAEVEKEKTAAVEAEVNQAAQEAEEELLKAKPIQEQAEQALNTLNKDNLTELKSFANPSADVVKVMEAVIILLNKPGVVPRDLSWKAAKSLMGNVDKFLSTLQNFDKEHINPVNKAAVLKYTSQANFNGEYVKSKSTAAAGICDWCVNILKFHDVFLFVEPLREKTEDLQGELEIAQKKLRAVEAQVNSLNESLGKLEAEFKAAEDKRDAVIAQAQDMENRLELANRLVNGLSSEKIRWKQSVETLKQRNQTLVGDVLVIAAFISYGGAFSRNYRSEMLKGWIDLAREFSIPIQDNFDPLTLLTDPAIIAQWNNDKLPTDRFSLENASIFTNCDRWPLIIDPQLEGMEWIKTREEKNNLKVIRLNQKDWLNVVKDAVENGYPVLVENISETIDAVLNPILGREIMNKGKPTQAIRIGDKEIPYSNSFRIYFQTKFANPHYSPEIEAQTTLINFTVTEEGLEDEMLADVVLEERPDLEELKTNLMRQQNEFAITLQQLEADLLQRLANAGDNIIEDIGLITNLEKTKSTSNDIAQKVLEAKQTEEDINKAREQYRAVASRSAMLYFLLNSLAVIDHFYQFSLAAFKVVFFRAIRNSEKSEDVPTRVSTLLDAITTAIYEFTSRGLFERHKLIFNSELCFNILKKAGQLPNPEFEFLLRGTEAVGRDNTLGDFISDASWSCVLALSENIPDVFAKLPDDIEGSSKRWKEWVEHETPEREKLPQDWKSKTPLQELCIIRALRPDRLLTAMTQFISNSIDPKYIEPVPFNMQEIFETSSRSEPIFFVLSPGVDPVKDVEALGKQLGYTFDNGLFKSVSLGQGQERNAERFVEELAQKGGWVLLENIHLMKNWQSKLEKLMDQVCSSASHENFRLMISAEPAADPTVSSVLPGIVQMCIKVTNEPPTGIKANMNRAMALFNNDVFESCSKPNEFKSILFALCLFHSSLLERRKFGSIGWNIPYNFTNGDLLICKDVLYNYLEANIKVPWNDLKYLFCEIFYGGVISDDLDRRFIKAYANELFSDALFEDGKQLAPDFFAPQPMSYDQYKEYLNDNLPPDNPKTFGLHPNAEITYLTSQSNTLFFMLKKMQPADAAIAGEGSDDKDFKDKIEELIQMIPETYNISDLMERNPDAQPYNCVCIEECGRMNILTGVMRQTLNDVKLGLNGELTISESMEKIIEAVRLGVVPDAWAVVAYPNLKGLAPWLKDLEQRSKELSDWSNELGLPKYVWLGGLFNPESMLRSVIETTARANQWPLDMMSLNVEVTKKELSDISSAPREGAYIYGLYMEGARWDRKSSSIRDAILKDLYPPMPPMFLKAVTNDKIEVKDTYECPLYKIKERNANTYVWTFNIKTREPQSKWILAGVAMLLANDL